MLNETKLYAMTYLGKCCLTIQTDGWIQKLHNHGMDFFNNDYRLSENIPMENHYDMLTCHSGMEPPMQQRKENTFLKLVIAVGNHEYFILNRVMGHELFLWPMGKHALTHF